MNPKTTLRGLILATLLITLPGAYAAPNKTAPAKTPAAKTAPAKPADNKKNAAKTPAKPADNKKTAAKTPAKPADNKKTAGKTPAKPADNKKTAAAKTPAKPADNKKTAAKTPAKPADNKKTAAASTKPAAKPAAAPAKKTNTCGDERLAALSAAREGKLDALKKYADKKCPFNITDTSGLTPYDLATLNGHKNITDWLIQNKHAKKDQHSSAYTKTLQTSLNFLGYNAGPANGKTTAATTNAIKAYQKANGLATTGKTDPSWLPGLNTQINKKLQQKLRAEGYDTGGSKGIIGAKSQNAIQEYRKKHKLGTNDNPQDSQLLAQLMNGDKAAAKNDKTKETAAAKRPPASIAAPDLDRRDAEQRATEAAEQQQAEAIARRQAEEREPAVPLAPPPVAVDHAAADLATANLQRAAAERQAALTRQENERRAAIARQAQQEARRRAAAADQATLELEQQTAERQSAARLAAEQNAQTQPAIARAEAERQVALAQQQEAQRQQAEAARARLAAAENARQQAEADRARFRAEATQRAQQIAATGQTTSADATVLRPAATTPLLAQNSPRPANALAAVATPTATSVPAPAAAAPKTRSKPGFNRISGSLNMGGNGSMVTHCTINGQNIDPGWCQQYYPDGSGKQCNAVISGSGSVVSLTCK